MRGLRSSRRLSEDSASTSPRPSAKAHAYAEAAKGLGEFRANGLLKRLEKEMSSDELQRATLARDAIYKEYRL